MKKRMISLLLAVVMIVGMLPMTILAADTCDHAAVETVCTDNTDGTHTVTFACEDCGEAVANKADAVAMDFTAFAAAAAEQSWWDDLRVDADENIHYQGALAADSAEDKEKYEGAYASLRAYAQEAFGWTIIEDGTTDVNNAGRAKKLFFNAGADAQWGMNFAISAGYKGWGAAYTMLQLNVDAPAAGTYAMDLTYFEDLSGAKFDLHVNPVMTGRDSDEASKVISGLNTRDSGNVAVDYDAGNVELVEGTNNIVIYINADTVGAQLKLADITFTPVALTVDCADEIDGDGKCDDCNAVIGTCQHRETETVITDNGDKTHTLTAACKFCGEAAADEENAVVIDFADFAGKAPQQTWWEGLHDPDTNDGIKQYGYVGMSDTTTAAYEEMIAWQKANLCWSINSASDFTNSGRTKNLYISTNEGEESIAFSTYYQTWGDAYSQLLLDVTVPASGTYDLSIDYLQGAYGCFTVFVNGEQVGEQISCSGDAARLTAALGTVTLTEGNDQIAVKITANRAGAQINYATTEVALTAISLAPVEVTGSCADGDEDGKCDTCGAQIGTCKHETETTITDNGDKTHTISTVCTKCGEDAPSAENVLAVDFADFAARASQQTWWEDLNDGSGAGSKQYGYTAMTEAGTAAYNEMLAWQKTDFCWSINETGGSDFSNSSRSKNLYIHAVDGYIAFSTYYMTWGDVFNQLLLDVTAPAAGTYDMSIDYLQGAYGCFTVFVNGEQVGEQISCSGDAAKLTAALGTVTLNEGSNQIAVKITGNRAGAQVSYATTEVALTAISLAPMDVTGACADIDGDGKCEICGAQIAACSHAELQETVVADGETHTVSYTCALCGEAVGNAEKTLSMDFKAFAEAASEKSFWDSLSDFSEGVKVYGGNVVTAEGTAAYENMLSWQGENFDWAIVENGSDYSNTGRSKKLYLNAAEGGDWGVNFYTYYNDWAGVYNVFKMAVYAREAGTYELDVDYLQTTKGAAFTVSVNGTQIGDEIVSAGAVEKKTVSLGTVELAEGENIVDVIFTKNFQGTAARLASDLYINAIDFVPVSTTADCADADDDTACDICGGELGCKHTETTAEAVNNEDGTHTVTYVCAACGEAAVSSEASISMDFMEAARKAKAEKPEMMSKLRQSNDPEVVFYGYKSAADAASAETTSLFDLLAMSNWIDANYDWNIDETKSLISDKGIYKRVYLNGADDAKWAFRFVPTMLTWDEGNRGLYLKLDVAQAGTYTMDFEYLQHAAVGVDLTNSGAKIDLKVNDEVVYSGLETDGAVEVRNLLVEGVQLVEGENIIAIIVTANKDGGVTNVNSSVDIRKIDFHPVSLTETCADADSDGVCDLCGSTAECSHANATDSYVENGDGTHDKITSCDCGMSETVTEDCLDEDADGCCDLCEGVLETPCDHTDTTTETVSNGDKTHTTTVTCTCGEVVSTETADCVDEDKDTYCDVCNAQIKTITKAAFAGSNMTLGNELEVNFLMVKKNLPAGEYTAVITQKMADGTERVTEVAMAEWGTMGTYHKISARIAAREMADDLYIEIKDAEGYVYNEEYFTSVRGYASRALVASTTTEFVRVMMIDMLNYGAAAQEHFKYNTSDLANNALTEEQQALATAKITCTDKQVKDATVYGANLSLEDSILLNTFFKGLKGKDIASMYAMVRFTDFQGIDKEVRMEGSEFEQYGSSGDIYKIVVDDVVLADAKTLVTVTLYNADGTVFGAGTDSVESYVARAEKNNADTYGLYANIMKFATSAYNYIINK